MTIMHLYYVAQFPIPTYPVPILHGPQINKTRIISRAYIIFSLLEEIEKGYLRSIISITITAILSLPPASLAACVSSSVAICGEAEF